LDAYIETNDMATLSRIRAVMAPRDWQATTKGVQVDLAQ
jgi:hypothetical protein